MLRSGARENYAVIRTPTRNRGDVLKRLCKIVFEPEHTQPVYVRYLSRSGWVQGGDCCHADFPTTGNAALQSKSSNQLSGKDGTFDAHTGNRV